MVLEPQPITCRVLKMVVDRQATIRADQIRATEAYAFGSVVGHQPWAGIGTTCTVNT